MERVEGDDLLDGVCAVTVLTGAGLAVRLLVGSANSLGPFGVTVLGVTTIACAGRWFKIWQDKRNG